jgi:hypothetical protein
MSLGRKHTTQMQTLITSYLETKKKLASLINVDSKLPYDVYIGRNKNKSRGWGNPFVIGKHGTREEVVSLFDEWFYNDAQRVYRERADRELAGKILACHCPPLRCHGETFVRYVNRKV